MYEKRVGDIKSTIFDKENKIKELTEKITEAIGRATEAG